MLQQTQVSTVIPYFEAFLGRFPSVHALANAPEDAVLTAWSGLGYYSRARNLHRGARFLVESRKGQFPTTREAILEVPGIGPYTAGAILSIAFDLPEPLVDGNVQRVFSRYYALRADPKSVPAQKIFWEKAREWISLAASPRITNQAIMELGATVCTKGTPRCDVCPLKPGCLAFKRGWQAKLPVKTRRKKTVDLWWIAAVISRNGRFLLEKNPSGQWWSDLWDFPHQDVGSKTRWKEPGNVWLEQFSSTLDWKGLDLLKHTVTHHRIHVAPFYAKLRNAALKKHSQRRWFSREEIRKIPLSSLAKKVLSTVPTQLLQ